MLEARYSATGGVDLAKIAVDLEQALARKALEGEAGRARGRLIAEGEGWRVEDVICTSGPDDRPFEEQHSHAAIAIVLAGSFQYRSATGSELMTPGSLLLGSLGQPFECAHEHGAGDRCISFRFAPEYFGRLAAEAGAPNDGPGFPALRVPPLRPLTALAARACAGLLAGGKAPWEEVAVQLVARTVELLSGLPPDRSAVPPGATARVTRTVRLIERHPDAALDLGSLAREAGSSPYHFLRTFERLTGVTPHQYVLRTRLREAAMRLVEEPAQVTDVALDCGFGDLSNFNRAFRTEFGTNPRGYRRAVSAALA